MRFQKKLHFIQVTQKAEAVSCPRQKKLWERLYPTSLQSTRKGSYPILSEHHG